MTIDFDAVEYLTFDCYGTLIDWEMGIAASLGSLLEQHGHLLDHPTLLEKFATFEAAVESGSFMSYRKVLEEVVDRFGAWLGFEATDQDRAAFSGSVPAWPPFSDSRKGLADLGRRFRLVVLSNVDDDLFVGSSHQLGDPFHAVFTAQQIGSYKPDLRNFRFAMDKLGAHPDQLVHVAQSLYHDIAPANLLGIRTVWINRRMGRRGAGATLPATARPDVALPSLAALVDYVRRD